jgi:hypothetical protein
MGQSIPIARMPEWQIGHFDPHRPPRYRILGIKGMQLEGLGIKRAPHEAKRNFLPQALLRVALVIHPISFFSSVTDRSFCATASGRIVQ